MAISATIIGKFCWRRKKINQTDSRKSREFRVGSVDISSENKIVSQCEKVNKYYIKVLYRKNKVYEITVTGYYKSYI